MLDQPASQVFFSRLKQADRKQTIEEVTRPQPGATSWIGYFAGWLLVMLGLGILVAYDVSNVMGERVQKFIFDEDTLIEKDPEYEEAERVWANGQHLANAEHRLGDFDLTILPENAVRFLVGYSYDRYDGPTLTTLDFQRDEFPLQSDARTRADNYRFGVEASRRGSVPRPSSPTRRRTSPTRGPSPSSSRASPASASSATTR